MKQLILSIATILAFAIATFAQAPQSFKYQAVARDASQQIIKNQVIGLRFSLIEGSTMGNSVYSEVHYPTTSDLGVFSLEVGKGIIQGGAMTNADWGNMNYFLRVELDPQGGNNFQMMGISQLLSVPYALHAATVADKDDADADPTNEMQNISFNSASNILTLSNGGQVDLSSLAGGSGGTDDQNLTLNGTILSIEDGNSINLNVLQDGVNDADADPNNELQSISFDPATNQLSISGGNTITIPSGGTDADADPTNEIQTISENGGVITLSHNGGSFVDDVNDADADPGNEIQNLTLANTMLMISDGNSVDLSVVQDGVNDADADPNNEIQNLTFNSNTNELSISGGNTVTIPSGGTDADADPTNELQTLSQNGLNVTLSNNGGTINIADNDNDTSNEIQTLSKNGNTISLSNGGGSITDEVNDADADPNNELQTISKNGNTVTLSNGGGSFTDEVNDADNDPANELQDLILTGTQLSIINGNTVDLSPILPPGGTDDQNLSLNGTTLIIEDGNSVDLSTIQDGVTDADADPTNELQNLSLQNDVLTISGTNSQVNLGGLISTPWKNIPNTQAIEYKVDDPLARITNTNETLTLNLYPDGVNFLDETECRTYLQNGALGMNREQKISNDLYIINPAMWLDKDSLAFEDYDDDFNQYTKATYDRRFAHLFSQIGNEKWSGTLEPWQLDLRINNEEVFGTYDAFGIHSGIYQSPLYNNYELLLKSGLGLYMNEEIGQDTLVASLTTPTGFNIGTGPGFGNFDEIFTRLNKDSLVFDYINVGGLQSGFATYGRDEVFMSFQAGPTQNSSCLSPFAMCLETGLGNDNWRMDLTSDYLEFTTNTTQYDYTIFSRDSIFMTAGNFFPGATNIKPGSMELLDFVYKTEFAPHFIQHSNISDNSTITTSPFGIVLDSSDVNNSLDFNSLKLAGSNPLPHYADLSKDSLSFFRDNVGLLLDDYSSMDASKVRFDNGVDKAELSNYGLNLDNTLFRTAYTPSGIFTEEILSSSDIFTRFNLEPDSLTMFNSSKWKTVKLGTNQYNHEGELILYGNGGKTHTYLGGGPTGSVMEMFNNGNERIFTASLPDYGIINTFGSNNSLNTWIGTAELVNDPTKGGMGVMNEFGLPQAGMEVSGTGLGQVYTNGEFSIYDEFLNTEISSSSIFGYSLYNPANGNNILSLHRDLVDPVGYLTLNDSNGDLNFFAGANYSNGGNANTGFAEVLDATGTAKAGMYVFDTNEGALYGETAVIGQKPSSASLYPLKVVQKPNWGLNMESNTAANNWEFYISDLENGNLHLWANSSPVGYFNAATGAYLSTSDKKLKTNIQQIDNILPSVLTLEPSRYEYKNNNPEKLQTLGFIAQDVQKLFPELVSEVKGKNGETTLMMDYSGFGVLAIRAIQEQQEVMETQAQKIEGLENRLAKLEQLIEEKLK